MSPLLPRLKCPFRDVFLGGALFLFRVAGGASPQSAVRIFDQTCEKPLLPLHEIDKDPVRKELDYKFGLEILGLPEPLLDAGGALDVLCMKMAQEPSIRGNK